MPGTSPLLTQLTDVAPRRPEPRLTDSQRFIRDEEEKLIDFVEKQKAEKKKAEDEQKKNRLPQFELQERQTAADLMLSPDDTHVFIVVAERAARREDHDRAELRDRDAATPKTFPAGRTSATRRIAGCSAC